LTNLQKKKVINFYFKLLKKRNHSFSSLPRSIFISTHLYPILEQSQSDVINYGGRNADIFTSKLLFVPVHLRNHWTLAVIDIIGEEIHFYDSLGGSPPKELGPRLNRFINLKAQKTKQDWNEVNFQVIQKETPEQTNRNDCGVFVLKNANLLSQGKALLYNEKDMLAIRKQIILEILNSFKAR
jgi:sentrin-specific protease 1